MTIPLGPLLVDFEGTVLSEKEKCRLSHPWVGGVVLFSRNYESREQLQNLTESIRLLRDPHLLITVDHEGGRVQRFQKEFTPLPSMASLGTYYLENKEDALIKAEQVGYTMANELKSCGIDYSFAPVLDLNLGISLVLEGGRAISSSPDIVVDIAKYYIKGMLKAGMQAIGKHFPGHGHVNLDSHHDLPIDEREFSEIEKSDFIPFIRLLSSLGGLMPAHIIFPKIDKNPASLSSKWLKNILREKLKFTGMVFSDCLSMKGAEIFIQNPKERVLKALKAGCDMVLLCNQFDIVDDLLNDLNADFFSSEDLAKKIKKLTYGNI